MMSKESKSGRSTYPLGGKKVNQRGRGQRKDGVDQEVERKSADEEHSPPGEGARDWSGHRKKVSEPVGRK